METLDNSKAAGGRVVGIRLPEMRQTDNRMVHSAECGTVPALNREGRLIFLSQT